MYIYHNIYNYNIIKNQSFLFSKYDLWTIIKHNLTTSKHNNEFEWKIWLNKLHKKKSVFLNQKHALQRNYDFNTLSQKWECIYARSHFIQVQIHTFTLLFELMKHVIFWKEIVCISIMILFEWKQHQNWENHWIILIKAKVNMCWWYCWSCDDFNNYHFNVNIKYVCFDLFRDDCCDNRCI